MGEFLYKGILFHTELSGDTFYNRGIARIEDISLQINEEVNAFFRKYNQPFDVQLKVMSLIDQNLYLFCDINNNKLTFGVYSEAQNRFINLTCKRIVNITDKSIYDLCSVIHSSLSRIAKGIAAVPYNRTNPEVLAQWNNYQERIKGKEQFYTLAELLLYQNEHYVLTPSQLKEEVEAAEEWRQEE